MKPRLLLFVCLICGIAGTEAQNVFNVNDPVVRYDGTKPLGSAQRPNPAIAGLQKWVSTPTNGVSLGSAAWDASSYKAYFLNVNGVQMAFRIKFPKSYANPDSAAKRYPIMLFLHGAGEVGCSANGGVYNNEKQVWLGGSLFRDRVNNNQFDGFLVYPQLVTTNGCWDAWGTTAIANLQINISMIDSLAKYARANIDRVLIAGLSGGGYGAWRMAEAYPQRITKIMPSAAAGVNSNRAAFVHLPIWFATGGKDPDPSPAQAELAYNKMLELGANIKYTQYADLGHAVWSRHWAEPGFVPEMNDMHKANPLVFFQRNEFCPNETIAARLGITAGFYAYEWQRENVTIATRINGVNTVTLPEHVTSFTGNEIIVKSFGTYQVRFKRTAASEWSVYSPKPAVVKTKATTQTAAIAINGAKSKVLPAPDGSTTVPLMLPAGFLNYEWYRVSDNALVANTQVFNAPVGVYRARYSEQYGCGTTFSPDFTVVDANGAPKPDAPSGLLTVPMNRTSIRLNWTQANNETGFEVYRALKSGGPFTYVSLTAANASSYVDNGLTPGTKYFYLVRAVNATGASATANESAARTTSDNSLPTAPSNLQYRGSSLSSVQLKWTAATDDDGIKRYDIYANGVKMFSTTATAFNVINLDSLKTYNFIVKAVDNNNNESPASNQVSGFTHRQGVNYRYYTSANFWSTLPDFNALTPAKSGITDSININNTAINPAITKYGFVWEGSIYIPVTATYTFETVSDDGTKLYLDLPYTHSATALVSNDGVHGMVSKTGTVTLSQGYHPIAVTYFQGNYGYGIELYWSNNAGLAREKVMKNFFAAENGAQNAAPADPSALTATANTYNKITLGWTDNSNDETGFEIVRSLSSTGPFVPAGTVPAGATAFLDSGLAAAKSYFYKVRAISDGSGSNFSAMATATTMALPGTPLAPSQLELEGSGTNSISLAWNDNSSNETGFRIYRSTNGLDYTLINTLASNINAYTDLTAVALTEYYYYVVGRNAAGEGERSNVAKLKSGNNAPVISQLAQLFAKTGQQAIEDFVVNDDPNDAVQVTIIQKPAFVDIVPVNATNFRLVANATQDNVGWYNLTIKATDQYGASSTATVAITVADQKTKSVFINFGANGKTAPAPWNNWLGLRTAGSSVTNLRDENNLTTTISLTSVGSWPETTILGHLTGNNSGIVPDAVLESGIADNGAAKQFRFSGLNTARRYNIAFVGSQNEGLTASAQYASGSQTAALDARYNTTRAAGLNGLVPDINGQILVTITRNGGSAYTYLNAVMIEEYDPSVGLLNPENLNAEPLDRNRIALTWSDRTNLEAAANGYELQRANDSLFTQNLVTIALAANTTSYTNTGLLPNTKYWYRVRVTDGASFSEFSNKFTVVTPASIVYVNFNTTIANAASPWNNLQSSPLAEFLIDNLKDQSNNNSGISIRLTKLFNGEFTAGVNTGSNSGIVPDLVLQSDFWLDNTQLGQFKLTGLNQSRRYRIGFVGSSSSTGWFKGNYTATYTVNGRTVYLNSWMNSTKVVYISDIIPNAGGELLLDFSTTAIGQWAFNAGIIIQEYNDAGGGSVLYQSNTVLEEDAPVSIAAVTKKFFAYPNPFADGIRIAFHNSAAGNKVSAEMFDAYGRLLLRQQFGNMPAGNNILRLTAPSSAPSQGVFMIALKIDGRTVETIKMLRNKR